MFIIPAKLLKLIDHYYRSYVWSGKGFPTRKALVAWEKMCCPKSAGGLNLINLQKWNRAAVSKLCWDLAHKEDKLWINVYYIKGHSLPHWPTPQQASWMSWNLREWCNKCRRQSQADPAQSDSCIFCF